jgi:hypothetical protein
MEETLQRITRFISPEINTALLAPISLEELKIATSQGKPNKAPGVDGIGLQLYRMGWSIIQTELLQIMNSMYSKETLLAHQVKGIMVYVTKKNPTLHA